MSDLNPDHFYDLIFADVDYAGGAARVHEIIQAAKPGASTLLDVGCGPARHLAELKRWYAVEGLDLSPNMLDQARARLPEVPFHLGDMRDFDLSRHFDAIVCLSSAIACNTKLADLRAAIARMARHLNEGGVLIVEPWDDPEVSPPTSEPYLTSHEEPGRKVVMLEITTLQDDSWLQESHYLIATPDRIDHFFESHQVGAFTYAQQIQAFTDAGLQVSHDPVGLLDRGLYIGIKS